MTAQDRVRLRPITNVAILKERDNATRCEVVVPQGVMRPDFVIWNHELYKLAGGPLHGGPWEYERAPVWWAGPRGDDK